MILVNLLPVEDRLKTRTPIPYLVSGLLFIVALLAMAGMWMSSRQAMAQVRSELDKCKTELNVALDKYDKEERGFANVFEEYDALEELKLKLAEKIDIIDEIVRDRIIWSEQLWCLSKLTPDNIWLTGVNVALRTFKDTVPYKDPKTKEYVQKTITVKRPVLEVLGYVIPDADGNAEIFPLAFKTQNDPEFKKLFELRDTKLDYAELFGYRVRSFALEYLINTGEESE